MIQASFSDSLLDVEVQGELVRMRAQVQLLDLVVVLVIDPGLDQRLAEDPAFHEERMVLPERVQGVVQPVRRLGDISLIFLGEDTQMEVEAAAIIPIAIIKARL